MDGRVNKIVQHSDRLMLVKIKTEPVNTVVIQVYMPTSAHAEEEVDMIYEELEELMDKERGKDNIIVMGDWNAIVGKEAESSITCKYELGVRNERGENK